MKVAHLQEANPSRGGIKSVWNERLLTASDFVESSMDLTELREVLARHNATKLDKELSNIKGAYKDVHSTNFFKHCCPTKDKTHASTSKPERKSKDPMYIVDSGASLYLMGESRLDPRDRKQQENNWRPGDPKRERYRPLHHRGEGLHPGAGHLPVRVKLVEDSSLVLSLGRLCDKWVYPFSRGNQKNIPNLKLGENLVRKQHFLRLKRMLEDTLALKPKRKRN